MLGRRAGALRGVGVDTLEVRQLDWDELYAVALAERRVVLVGPTKSRRRPGDRWQSDLIELFVKYHGESQVGVAEDSSDLDWQKCGHSEKALLLGVEASQMAEGQ